MTLVLWDIDGTLVDVRGSGRKAFARAIELTWGVVDDLGDVRFAGATDLLVLEQLRTRLTLDAVHEERFFANMAAVLAEMLAGSPAHALPGAVDAVHTLRERGVVQGLVTGNAVSCARIKLRSAGIDVDAFMAGGYGDEHADRLELAVRARQRCGDAAHTFLVGDTPMDVRAAKHIGATAVAVIGHAYERVALEAAGADVVLDSLVDVAKLIPG